MPIRPVLLSFLTVVLIAPAVSAGTQDDAVIALHDRGYIQKSINICPGLAGSLDPITLGISCSDFHVDNVPTLSPRTIYLVVGLGDSVAGIGGVSCGIDFTSQAGIFGWTLCADLEFPNSGPNGPWPAAGGGNRITWDITNNCQRTVIGSDGAHAVAGAFYVYAYGDGHLSITPNQNVSTPELKVSDCSAAESDIRSLGGLADIGFGFETGFNPCFIADCGCGFSPSASVRCCCLNDQVHTWQNDCRTDEELRAVCEDQWGGAFTSGACTGSGGCIVLCTVATEPTSWGRLKTRY